MGCDIHGWVEKKVAGKWVAVSALENPADERNYLRFAALAGVRGEGLEPRGVPEDVSDTAKFHIDQWNGDGHSHSWLPIEEAMPIWQEVRYKQGEVRSDYALKYPYSYWFGVDDAEGKLLSDYRVVFWFDN